MASDGEFLVDLNMVASTHLQNIDERINKANIRISDAITVSISLRVLFERGFLGRVVNNCGLKLRINTPNLGDIPYLEAILFSCSGHQFQGRYCKPYYMYREPGERSAYRHDFERQRAQSPDIFPVSSLSLNDFEKSHCISIFGRAITRRQAFIFVANKCGGAHALNDAKDIDNFKEFEKDLIVVSQTLNLRETGLNIVFSEVIATAWFLISSHDVIKIRKIIASHAENVLLFPAPTKPALIQAPSPQETL